MKKFVINTIDWFYKKIAQDHVDTYAAQSAFFIIISFFPFTILLLSFFNFININGQTFIQYVISLLPKDIGNLIEGIVLVEYQPVAILSVAGFACLWSASKATLAIIKGLNSVFEVDSKTNYFKIRFLSIFYTLIFVLVLISTAILLVFGNSLYKFITNNLFQDYKSSFFDYKYILVFAILSLFFLGTYRFLSVKTKIPLRILAIGATFSSLGWMIFSFFFSIFIENFSNYANMYGSFAALVIFMLWLYICMYITLLGGEISMWIHKEKLHIIETFRRSKT